MKKITQFIFVQKYSKYLFLGIVSTLLFSCSSTKYSTVDTEYIAKSGIMTKPTVAEIEVGKQKVEGSVTIKSSQYFPDPLEAAKNLAIRDAIKKGQCDLLVQPMFDIEKNTQGFIIATVTGFPAKYKNFRDFELSDTITFHVRNMIDNNKTFATQVALGKPQDVIMTQKKNSGIAATAVVIGVLLLTSLLIALL